MDKVKEDLANVLKALAESQSKADIIKAYAEETKRSLDIARKENGEQVLKIEELIKEKIKLAGELDSTAKFYQPQSEPYANPNEETKQMAKELQQQVPAVTPTFISSREPAFQRQSYEEGGEHFIEHERKFTNEEIDDKLQDILRKCTLLLYEQ